MSLCYDFEKWTIISLASIAISLTIGLLLINFAHGQNITNQTALNDPTLYDPNCDINASSMPEYCLNDSNSIKIYQPMTQEQREALVNYCFQHADRPNPIQDLIDKGFLPSSFKGETCLSVKQAYDEEQIRINNELKIKEQQEALLAQQQDNAFILYNECLQNKTTTYEDCYNFLKGNKTN